MAINTIGELIKEGSSNGLGQAVGNPDYVNLSFFEQAKLLLLNDEKGFQRLGKNFLMRRNLHDSLNTEFSPFQAEPLLREGSLLLDRCLQERREYDDLHAKWFEAQVQVDEMIRLSQLTDTEIKEIDAIQEQLLDAEVVGLTNQRSSAEANETRLSGVNQGWTTETNDLDLLIQRTTKSNLAANQCPDGPMNFEPGDSSHGWVIKGARRTTELQRKYDKLRFDLEGTNYSNARQTAQDSLVKTERQIDLKNKLREFKRQRNEVSLFVALRRAKELTKSSGALNYKEQMQPIKERFRNDLVAAWLRLKAANEGFKLLYGSRFTVPGFPDLSEVLAGDLEKPELTDSVGIAPIDDFVGKFDFDDLVTWAQLTNTWLAAFLDTQQLVTRSFSLLQLLGNNVEAFNNGKATGTWPFRLSENDFSSRTYVRLRSLTVQIDSDNRSGAWNVSVIPPSEALIKQSSNEEPESLHQTHIGTLFLGKVNERTFAVVPEAAAPPRLYNASPIGAAMPAGQWTLSVLHGSTAGATLNDIRDIDIHLTVALV